MGHWGGPTLSLVLHGFPEKGRGGGVQVESWVWETKVIAVAAASPLTLGLSLPTRGCCGHAAPFLPLHPGQPPWVLAKTILRGVLIFLIQVKQAQGESQK